MKRKLRMLYDSKLLYSAIEQNHTRSGLYFVALNLLKEFAKNENIEIYIFYEYQMYEVLKAIQEKGIIPKNVSLIAQESLKIPFIANLVSFFFKLKLKYKKNNIDDNLLKKIIRYIAVKLANFYNSKLLKFTFFYKELNNFDIYFSPCHTIPSIIKNKKKLLCYMLIHDLIPFVLKDFYKSYDKQLSGMRKIINSISNDNKYFSVSECTKNDILKYFPKIDPNNITVTYNATDETFVQIKNKVEINKIKEKYGIPVDKKYIFSLCTLEPRKNLHFAIKNFIQFVTKYSINDTVYAIGGSAWNEFSSTLENYKDKFIRLGYVKDEDLPTLYSGALMFVYPSLYEGFGLPVLEAMNCGCPVITSNTSSLPEVVGDSGIMIDPKSDTQIINAYRKMYFDKEFRDESINKGLNRAKMFSWKNTVDIMYKKFIEDIKNSEIYS